MSNSSNTTAAVTLTCEICSEYFTDPLMLPCLHSFCKKCLLKAKEEQGTEDGCLKCFTCDTSVSLPAGKVEGLTQNLWLAHQVKEASWKDAITSQESRPCSQCIDDSSSKAVAFCCDCCKFLCSLCKKMHQRGRETVHHELVEVGAGKKASNNEMPTFAHQPVYCVQHKDEKLKFYCQSCEALACRDCILVKHKDHKYTDYFEEGDSARETLKQSITNCSHVISSVDEAIGNGEKMLQKVETRKEEVDKEIKETFSLLQAALEKRCKELLMDSEEIASKKRKRINEQLTEFRKLKKQVSHASQLALAVIECRDPGDVLSIKKLIADRLTQCDTVFRATSFDIKETEAMVTHLDEPSMSKDISKFGGVFEVDPLQFSIDTGVAVPMATVGKERRFQITVPNAIDNPAEYIHGSFVKCDDSKEEGKAIISKDNNITTLSCTAASVGEFQVSLTMRGHHITGSPYQLFVKGQRNLASLTNQRNYSVGSNTFGVVVHSNGNIFAGNCNNGYIQVFTNDGTAIRTIGTKGSGNGQFGRSFGLLLVGDRLYVSDDNLHRVQYFSATTGEYLGQFGCQGNGQGQFTYPRGMSYDGKDKIFVADYSNSRVQVFKLDGTYVQTIPCNGVPADVAVDNEGNIHVTIYDQHYVQVFSPDGHCLHTYNNPNGYLQYPTGIAIDDEGYCFITSRHSSGTNYLNILSPAGTQVNLVSGFSNPWGVALDKEGYIYIADYGNSRIMKY